MKKRLGRYVFAVAACCVLLFGTVARAAEYRYDDQGRLIRITYDNGNYVEYQYDKNGNLLEVTESRPPETSAPETSAPETSSPETSAPETSPTETGDSGETEATKPEETTGTEETRESETGTSAEETTEETRESETQTQEETEETKNSGGGGRDKENGSEEGESTWQELLTKWLNQSLIRYKRMVQQFKEMLQKLFS